MRQPIVLNRNRITKAWLIKVRLVSMRAHGAAYYINGAWLVSQRAAVVVGLWAVMAAERSPLVVTRTRSPSTSSYSSSSPLVQSANDKVH